MDFPMEHYCHSERNGSWYAYFLLFSECFCYKCRLLRKKDGRAFCELLEIKNIVGRSLIYAGTSSLKLKYRGLSSINVLLLSNVQERKENFQ